MLNEIEGINLNQIIGGCIAVIVAGMPAIIALLKIRELSIHVDGRLDQLLEKTEKIAHNRGFKEGTESEIARQIAEQKEKEFYP